MAEILVPQYITTQMCMPYGTRQSKKPMLPVESNLVACYVRTKYGVIKGGYTPKEVPGVFENWEYRFWMCEFNTKNTPIPECRACGAIGPLSAAGRKSHFVGGCAKKLCKAYELLKKDARCVICDIKTSRTNWGVPLCEGMCTQKWCESDCQPKSLLNALQLIGDE